MGTLQNNWGLGLTNCKHFQRTLYRSDNIRYKGSNKNNSFPEFQNRKQFTSNLDIWHIHSTNIYWPSYYVPVGTEETRDTASLGGTDSLKREILKKIHYYDNKTSVKIEL